MAKDAVFKFNELAMTPKEAVGTEVSAVGYMAYLDEPCVLSVPLDAKR